MTEERARHMIDTQAGPDEMKISRWTGEFSDPAIEHEFRENFYESQWRQVRTLSILLAIAFFPVGYIEYMNTGHMAGFDLFLAGHIFSGVLIAIMGYAVWKRWSYKGLEYITLAFFIYVVVESAFLLNIYRDEIVGIAVRLPLYAVIGNVMTIIDARTRITLNLAAAPVFIGAFWVLEPVSEEVAGTVTVVVLLGFVFGIAAGSWMSRTRRVEFHRRNLLLASNAALRESRQKAEEAMAAKSMFLANVSHELRTPLNAIIGFSQIVQKEIYGPVGHRKYQEYMDDIHGSGVQLLDLINDLLDLTKIETGNSAMPMAWFDLESAMSENIRLVKAANQATQPLSMSLETETGIEIQFNARAFGQILVNLLTNAVKYAGEGAEIHLSARHVENGVTITVSDTGRGMTSDELARVLLPFQQQEASISRKQDGWGLGLPIAHALAEANQATLTLESEPDRGTKAILTISSANVKAGAHSEDSGYKVSLSA